MTGAQIRERAGSGAKQFLARLWRFGGILDEVHDLAFGNAADLIEMEAALAFLGFGILGGAEKSVNNHGDGGDSCAPHDKHKLPIGKQCFQRCDSIS